MNDDDGDYNDEEKEKEREREMYHGLFTPCGLYPIAT